MAANQPVSIVTRILETDISLESRGEGPGALIFLHGGGGGRSDWAAQMEHFGPSYRVVAVDLPGHGASSTPANATIEHMAAVVTEVKKRWGLRNNLLVGHSMGCWAALESYRQDSTGIAGLVLIECSQMAADAAQCAALQQQVRSFGGKNLLRASYQHMFLPDADPELVAFCQARVEALSEPFIEDLILSTISWDATAMAKTLQSLQVPLLILQSTRMEADLRRHPLRSPEESSWITFARAHAPAAEVQVIGNAGHFPNLDQPAAVNRAVEHFAAAVFARSAE